MQYTYKITNLNNSSAYYGNCEVCSKPVSEVHIQTRYFFGSHKGDIFGHKDCLIANRQSHAPTADEIRVHHELVAIGLR